MLSKLLVVLSIMVIVAPFGAPAYAQTVLVDHFAGVTLDASLQGGLNTGDPVLLSGTVSDAAITQILFRFTPDSEGDPVPFFLDVSMGRFDRSVLFDHSQADVYTLEVFAVVTEHLFQDLGGVLAQQWRPDDVDRAVRQFNWAPHTDIPPALRMIDINDRAGCAQPLIIHEFFGG